jgi:hypothetical protein
MTSPNEERRPAGNGAAHTTTGEEGLPRTVTPLAQILTMRRPCARCHADRPLVAVGCAAGWNLCYRCYAYSRPRVAVSA